MTNNLEKAKTIFFNYDGSAFYMSRDGIDTEYRTFNIANEQERLWLKELTNIKLSNLAKPSNYRSIIYFIHHADYSHINEILKSKPLGQLWEKCAFLEELLEYIKYKKFDRNITSEALEYILIHAKSIIASSRSKNSTDRIEAIMKEAELRIKINSKR